MMIKISSFLLLAFVHSSAAQGDACFTGTVDSSVDYFPNKVEPTFSKFWTVSYHNTYKIVTNLEMNASYLLYQCGSEPPADAADGTYASVIPIPVNKTAVEQTVTLPYLEQLGKLDTVVLFLTDPQYISSPCFRDRVEAGEVLIASDSDQHNEMVSNAQQPNQTELLQTLNDLVAFVSPFSNPIPLVKSVNISSYRETTNEAIFEWVKFYSLFFNLEERANQVVEAAAARYKCVSDNAGATQTDKGEKPTVLWGYYSDYCQGWDVAECPNYYCEFANACSAEILYDDGSAPKSIESCDGVKFMNITEFVNFGKDADHWIFPGPNWVATYETFGAELDQMKSVQNKEVYDYQGAGENAWFEERYASYYDVLQDFCSVVGTTRKLPVPGWFRNVFTEPIGANGTCIAGKHSILPYNFACDSSEFDLSQPDGGASSPSSGATNNGDASSPSSGATNNGDAASPSSSNKTNNGGAASPSSSKPSGVVQVQTLSLGAAMFAMAASTFFLV